MALFAGTLTISAGGVASGVGLSREIYDEMASALSLGSVGAASTPAAQERIAALATAIAEAVVQHIKSNALVTVNAGIPVATTGSASAQTGSTTSTGTGTVS